MSSIQRSLAVSVIVFLCRVEVIESAPCARSSSVRVAHAHYQPQLNALYRPSNYVCEKGATRKIYYTSYPPEQHHHKSQLQTAMESETSTAYRSEQQYRIHLEKLEGDTLSTSSSSSSEASSSLFDASSSNDDDSSSSYLRSRTSNWTLIIADVIHRRNIHIPATSFREARNGVVEMSEPISREVGKPIAPVSKKTENIPPSPLTQFFQNAKTHMDSPRSSDHMTKTHTNNLRSADQMVMGTVYDDDDDTLNNSLGDTDYMGDTGDTNDTSGDTLQYRSLVDHSTQATTNMPHPQNYFLFYFDHAWRISDGYCSPSGSLAKVADDSKIPMNIIEAWSEFDEADSTMVISPNMTVECGSSLNNVEMYCLSVGIIVSACVVFLLVLFKRNQSLSRQRLEEEEEDADDVCDDQDPTFIRAEDLAFVHRGTNAVLPTYDEIEEISQTRPPTTPPTPVHAAVPPPLYTEALDAWMSSDSGHYTNVDTLHSASSSPPPEYECSTEPPPVYTEGEHGRRLARAERLASQRRRHAAAASGSSSRSASGPYIMLGDGTPGGGSLPELVHCPGSIYPRPRDPPPRGSRPLVVEVPTEVLDDHSTDWDMGLGNSMFSAGASYIG